MRELKFRIWYETDKCFIYCEPFDPNTISGGGYNKNRSTYYWFHPNANIGGELCKIENFCPKKDTVIQQFTGLKDRDGNEIYEGDILEFPWPEKENNPFYEEKSHPEEFWERGIVKYYPEYARFGLEFYSPYGGEGYTGKEQHISDYAIGCSIIGNIFENPELIK